MVLNISGCSIERWATSGASQPGYFPLGDRLVAICCRCHVDHGSGGSPLVVIA
jgi:hypothetical protein